MKRTITLMIASLMVVATTSCTTTYDAYGRPVQSVDPGTAAAGAAAAGALGYAIGRNNSNDRHVHHYHGGPRHRGGYYHPRGRWHRR